MLPPGSRSRINGDPVSKTHLFLDIDNTLLDTVEETDSDKLDGIEKIKLICNPNPVFIVIRPFARWFLAMATKQCKSVSIWTNGTPQWSRTISELVFADVPWFVVLNRTHSVRLNKVMQRVYECPDYPMTAKDTFIIDDSPLTAEINPNNCLRIKEFQAGPMARMDAEFVKIATRLGWVSESPHVAWETSIMTKDSPTVYDPSPFGLANQKLWCYFNSVTQCMLRTPSIMRRVSKPLSSWFTLIQKHMGEGTQDAGEALVLMLHPILNSPSQVLEGSTEKPDDQALSKCPVCLVYIKPNQTSTDQELKDYFNWKVVDNGEGINGNKKIRSVWPGSCITSVVMVVHRNANQKHVDRTPVFISPCIVTPDNRIFYLRGIVSHKGSAQFGHYMSAFFRHDGTAWVADDTHITRIDTRQKLIESQSMQAAIIFYDEVGTFL
jgi:hypothetical protein